ncbi:MULTISPECIES: DUF1329 domain-containing protein [Endozoicomonas]|uniref:DUF1329 domain-containing protein n=1 Tax=Endozoicomonas TaxID=305899 RepID=UPI0008250F16|nr:DUF1329 domain-containing protein [Endozoicomonas atrinae]
MKITKSLLAVTMAGMTLMATSVSAKVSEEEAARLGKDLTPFGGEMAGNAEGTIPAWNPDFQPPASYKPGDYYPDPYADEKPLFVITAENMSEHKDKLTPGMQALFKTYPKTFKMPVYKTHRDAMYSDFSIQQVRANATRAELTEDGNGVINAFGSVPFPIPEGPLEVVWNMAFNNWPYFSDYRITDAVVYRNGSRLEGVSHFTRIAPYFNPELDFETFQKENLPRSASIIQALAPTREKGKTVLVHEFVNQSVEPRAAWSYTPGIRRVRRAPTVKYDSPAGLGNWRTTDESYGFNGATDKYNWTLLGKQEMYVPYNAYRFEDPSVSLDELLTQGHPNPKYMRYELHRVWVVKAELKEGERNVYKTRVLFIDEDHWNPVVVDQYDNRDELWRTTMVNSINLFDMPGMDRRSTIHHDLISREYFANEIRNPHPPMVVNREEKELSYFTSSTLKKLGVR